MNFQFFKVSNTAITWPYWRARPADKIDTSTPFFVDRIGFRMASGNAPLAVFGGAIHRCEVGPSPNSRRMHRLQRSGHSCIRHRSIRPLLVDSRDPNHIAEAAYASATLFIPLIRTRCLILSDSRQILIAASNAQNSALQQVGKQRITCPVHSGRRGR